MIEQLENTELREQLENTELREQLEKKQSWEND